MSSSGQPPATVVVMELGTGLVYFQISDPNLPPDRIELLLIKTIDAWFQSHPHYVLDRTQDRLTAGRLRGIHVWYDELATPRPMSHVVSSADPSPAFTIEFLPSVVQLFPREYLEAVVDEVMELASTHSVPLCSLVVVNTRKLAVILDLRANRGNVVLVESVYTRLDDSARRALESWLDAPTSRLFLIELSQSWSSPQYQWVGTRGFRDCSVQRTNMIYDTEPRAVSVRSLKS